MSGRNEPHFMSKLPSAPAPNRTGYGNVGLFLTLGSHVGLCGLPGGAEGIRTSDLREAAGPSTRARQQDGAHTGEITSSRADFLVELRGFEPMAISVR
jgi:hypothetical protein